MKVSQVPVNLSRRTALLTIGAVALGGCASQPVSPAEPEKLVESLLDNLTTKRVEIDITHVETAGGEAEARVAVRDYGPGIAPEHLPRLTERFYRVDVAGSRAQGGTGLGLALVKHIMNRHRGRLSISSAPGQGATFTVHLPIPGAAAARADHAF